MIGERRATPPGSSRRLSSRLSRRFFGGTGLAWMLPALLLVGILHLIPLVRLAGISFGEHEMSLAPYGELFGAWSYGGILLRSLRISAMTVIGCLLFGYPIGYVLAFSTPRRRALLSLLVLLPFWTSILVRNFAWIYLLRTGGVLSTVAGILTQTGEPAQLLYNEIGVLTGMVGTLLPFMVFPVFIAIASQNRHLGEVAGSLGASPARVFFAIALPLSRNGIYAGSLLIFTTAIGFFITPALLGGGRTLMTATFINQQIEQFVNWPLAAAAAMVLLAIVTVLIVLYRRVMGPHMFGVDHAVS